MNKTKYAAISLLLLTGIVFLSKNMDTERKNQCTIANIEALSNGENPKDLWCCGTTGVCVNSPNLVIIGKISEKPCE